MLQNVGQVRVHPSPGCKHKQHPSPLAIINESRGISNIYSNRYSKLKQSYLVAYILIIKLILVSRFPLFSHKEVAVF